MTEQAFFLNIPTFQHSNLPMIHPFS